MRLIDSKSYIPSIEEIHVNIDLIWTGRELARYNGDWRLRTSAHIIRYGIEDSEFANLNALAWLKALYSIQ